MEVTDSILPRISHQGKVDQIMPPKASNSSTEDRITMDLCLDIKKKKLQNLSTDCCWFFKQMIWLSFKVSLLSQGQTRSKECDVWKVINQLDPRQSFRLVKLNIFFVNSYKLTKCSACHGNPLDLIPRTVPIIFSFKLPDLSNVLVFISDLHTHLISFINWVLSSAKVVTDVCNSE